MVDLFSSVVFICLCPVCLCLVQPTNVIMRTHYWSAPISELLPVCAGLLGVISCCLGCYLYSRGLYKYVLEAMTSITSSIRRTRRAVCVCESSISNRHIRYASLDRLGYVAESIATPQRSHTINVSAAVELLDRARIEDARVVFASSAAIYGPPAILPISEYALKKPTSRTCDGALAETERRQSHAN